MAVADDLTVVVKKDETVSFLLHVVVSDGERSAYTTCGPGEEQEAAEDLKKRLIIGRRKK